MKNQTAKTDFDGIAVFDRPLLIDNVTLFGVLYNIEYDKRLTPIDGGLESYIAFHVGVERFLQNGGKITNDFNQWEFPDNIHTIFYNPALARMVSFLMKGEVSINKLEFDEPIKFYEDEVDDKEHCFIVKKDLIDRYLLKIKENDTKETGK